MHLNSIANLKKGNAAPRCQYIRLNDQLCTQPALKDHIFCRFHELLEHPLPPLVIPFVEDATSLQVAVMKVIKSLQLGKMVRRTAGTILYALQLASSNLKHFCEEVGHPFAQPAPRKTRKEQIEKEALAGPSLAEMLIERLKLVPRDKAVILSDDAPKSERPAVGREQNASKSKDPVFPPGSSASSVVKDVPDGGVIDKLEACCERPATSDRRLARFAHDHLVLAQEELGGTIFRAADDGNKARDLAPGNEAERSAGGAGQHGPVRVVGFADFAGILQNEHRAGDHVFRYPLVQDIQFSDHSTLHGRKRFRDQAYRRDTGVPGTRRFCAFWGADFLFAAASEVSLRGGRRDESCARTSRTVSLRQMVNMG